MSDGPRTRWGTLAGTLLLAAVAVLGLLFGRVGRHPPLSGAVPDAPAFALLRTLDRGVGPVTWSPDGRQLAGVGANAIVLWDVVAGRRIRSMEAPAALAVAWSPDGQTLAVGTGGNGIWLIDPTNGRRRGLLGQEADKVEVPSEVASVAWSPDGRALATADDWPGTIIIWNTLTWHAQARVSGQRGRHLSSLAWSPDGRHLAAMVDDAAQIWDAGSGQLQTTLGPLPPTATSNEGNPGIPPPQWNRNYSLAWARDGRRLALVGPGSLQVWDSSTGREVQSMLLDPLPANPVYPLAWWGGDRWLLGPPPAHASPWANSVGLWDPASGQAATIVPLGAPRIEAFVPSPDGSLLAVSSGTGLAIWGSVDSLPGMTPNGLPTPTLWQLVPTATAPITPGLPLPAPAPTRPGVPVGSPGLPLPVTTGAPVPMPTEASPRPLPRAFVDCPCSPKAGEGSAYHVTSLRNGVVRGVPVSLIAGSLKDNNLPPNLREFGMVQIDGAGPHEWGEYSLPTRTGPLRITAAQGTCLTLVAADQGTYHFDVLTRLWHCSP